MENYGSVIKYELQPLPVEALATFRKNAEEFVEKNRNTDSSYAEYISTLLFKTDFDLLRAIAEDDRWSIKQTDDHFILVPPCDEIKGGIDYSFIDWLVPYVSGFIQIDYDAEDREQWRIVWRDGKRGRRVDPIWPEPKEE